MKTKKIKHTKVSKVIRIMDIKPFKPLVAAEESDGFCICPNCFHLVFDEMLTGTCPSCHYHFCAACVIKKPGA